VSLNEAALDSPTFRASAVAIAEQMEGIERWLDGYTRSTSKLVHDMLGLEESINTYLAKMAPPAQSVVTQPDAVIDTDYTLLALRRAADGARDWWAQTMQAVRRLEGVTIDPIRNFVANDLRTFKEARRGLETAQKTFDSTLARYVGQTKTKEPSSLREDAFALYETRKSYLKASMDYCQLVPQLRFSLDKLLVRASADMCRELRRSREAGPVASKLADEMERIRGWSKEMEAAEPVFRRELQIARRDIGENTLALYRPSRELEDYSSSTVPYLGSRGPMSAQRQGSPESGGLSEKQGWLFLFMRNVVGKSIRTNWIRRWYYCRDGAFGWLVQGPQGVLQGDEIGVLLCSAKPAVQEERRFCFEVKTKTQTLLLQAETQTQLMEWLEVFEVAKKKAFEASMGRDSSTLPGGVDPAFSIISSPIPEFSAKQLENLGRDDQQGETVERSGTLPVPGPDGNLASRSSFDVTTTTGPRRSITALGREEGESSRDHAARIIQKLDLHRKAQTFNAAEGGTGLLAPGTGGGGIASLISASHNLLPGYTGYPSPNVAASASPRAQPTTISVPSDRHAGSLGPMTLARPPVTTYLSRAAVLASAERGTSAELSRGMPTAVVANYWGSGPWASSWSHKPDAPRTPLPDPDDPFIATVQAPTPTTEKPSTPISAHRKTVSADVKFMETRAPDRPVAETFPPKYPPELRVQHAQFRLLFPSVPLEEKLVLVFNAAWTSSSEGSGDNQQGMAGNGRVFVTPDNMYFYGHQLGLIVAYTISLDIITEVTAAPGRDCDFIFLHLGQDMNDTGFTRVTLKIFLEDLPLLHSRLNLLVDDLQSEEPMDLEEIVSALINLEKEDFDRKSPSVESWEEVSSNTPIDDGTASGRPVFRRVPEPNNRGYRASRSLRKQLPKFQLPANPILYEPEGMGAPVAERHFEISAKACFHVLFGDKSFIFPKLYFERRAKEIAQGPWELADHGTMRREFKFKVDYVDMLGRKKPGDVTDSQTIDIFQDHITYVVTHNKTPWHLPHSQSFKLVSKVVITHVAKSKCKLAIFTKVDWAKAPAFAKNIVQRQATDDAANDAEELAEVATDQVRKLGAHSRTKRAIQVYGNIGQQTSVVVFTPNVNANAGTDGAGLPAIGNAKRPAGAQVRPRTLTHMMLETGRSFVESVITSLMMWSFAALRKVFSVVTANRFILVLLASSALYNLIVTSQAGSSWWSERKAASYMNRIGVGPNLVMSKAIYLADLEEAARGSAVSLDGLGGGESEWLVFTVFQKNDFI
jgi:hypothetical protein